MLSIAVEGTSHPFEIQIQHIEGSQLNLLKDVTTNVLYYPLKDICRVANVKYSRIRSLLHRRKVPVKKIVLGAELLQDFKVATHYETSASHLQFIDEVSLLQLLRMGHCTCLDLVFGEQWPTLLSAAEQSLQTYGNASLEPLVRSSTSTVATDDTPAAAEQSCTNAIEMPTREEPAVYESIDSQNSVAIEEAVKGPVRNVTQLHDLLESGEMDVDVSGIDVSPVEDVMPSHDLPASGGVEADNVSPCTLGTLAHPLADVDDADLAKGIKSVIKLKCYTLQNFDMTRLNHTEFHGFREFFSRTRDPRRGNTRARNAQTISKARERICGYLGWLKESGRVKHPSFSDFEDVDTFLEKYVDGYLLLVRGLSHGTVANCITAALDVLKFRQAQSEDPFAPCDSIAKLKYRRNKEQTLAERERRLTIEDGNASIVWEQFLEAVRSQRLVVERMWTQGQTGKNDSMPLLVREMQKYLALTFYSAIPPSRSKEIRLITDRILSQTESQKCLQNHIALIHGRHVLVVSDYKNRHTNGLRDAIELPSDPEIILKYLECLLQPTMRAQITKGKQHGFLFCKQNGEAFENAGEWSMYLASIIERHVALKNISTNALRHSFTTYMESVDGVGDHTRLRESTAYAMRHTL
ncbi:hypothetical protein HK104_000128, partial [Borealophlyctis nickersoniae]